MDMLSFTKPANGKETPKSIERKRKMAEAMMQSGMDTSPIASPWQAGARIAQALVGGYSQRKADQAEAEGQQSARDAMTKALMGGSRSDMLDAVNNPFMDNESRGYVFDALKQATAPPPPPELKDLGNGQFYQYDPQNPQGGQVFTPQGYHAPPGSRLITGEEAVKMGLPLGAYNVAPDGKVSAIGGGGTNVTVNNGGVPDGKLRDELDKATGKTWGDYQTQAGVSAGMMQDMQLLDELIKMAPQGPITGRLAGMFKGSSSAGAAFQSVVSRVAPTLRTPGSGSTSDIEYDGMLNSLPALSNYPEANAAISGMMQAKAQINMERGQIVDAYQNGEISGPYARQQLAALNKRSIMTPELKQLIGGLAPAPSADGNDELNNALEMYKD